MKIVAHQSCLLFNESKVAKQRPNKVGNTIQNFFAISFEISKETIENSVIFVCKSWKILTLENLLCDIKYEFNSDNYRLYSKSLILAEGSI